jgi:hypothetical protein
MSEQEPITGADPGDPDEADAGAPEPIPDGPKNDPVPEDEEG